MTERKSKEPIEAFGPELMAALLAGGRSRTTIRFDQPGLVGFKFAHTFRRRIHTLRQRMRELNHPHYEIAMRAQVHLYVGDKAIEHGAPESWRGDHNGHHGALVVIQPRDSEFAATLAASGITPQGADPEPTYHPNPEGSEAHRVVSPLPTPQEAKEDYDALLDELEGQQHQHEV